jgi:hypothetical protein
MQPEPWTYRSLHDYLDNLFENRNPDQEEIIQAKNGYWRSYNTRLKQIQRKTNKQISLMVSKDDLKLLQPKLAPNQSVSDYIKNLLEMHFQNDEISSTIQKKDLLPIEQQLFILIDYLESLLYQRKLIDKTQMLQLEKYIQNLQLLLEEKF